LSVVGCQSGTRFSRSLFSFSSVGDYGGLLGWKRDESRRQARKFRSGKWGQVILRRPTFDLSLSSGAGNFSLAWTKGLPGLRRGSDGQRERAAGQKMGRPEDGDRSNEGEQGQVPSDLVRGTARIPGLRSPWNKLGGSCILTGRLTNSVVLSEETLTNAPYIKVTSSSNG
jgi:hypothetical protein